MNNGISVIICCYNSASKVPKTLEHLAKQNVANDIAWEIILIDNFCTDNTISLAKAEWEKYNLPIKLNIFSENNAGLNFARKKGVENAQYEYCVFCDDDNWLSPNYINIMYNTFLKDNNIGIIGGYGQPVTEIPPPTWFEDFKYFYAIGEQAKQTGYVTKERKFVFGAGMGIKKSLYIEIENLNFKSPLTDRKGNELTSGGDTQLCYLSILLGKEIYYNSSLTFKHFITKNRLNRQYLFELFDGFALADSYLSFFYNYLNEPLYNKNKLYVKQLIHIAKFIRFYKRLILKLFFFNREPEISIPNLLSGYYLKQFKLLVFKKKRYYAFIKELNKVAKKNN